MATESKDTFFSQYGKKISAAKIKKNSAIPFKDNAQFPILVDILSRKESHHAILQADFSPHLNIYFLEALLSHFDQENISAHLRGIDLMLLDMANFFHADQKKIEKDFLAMIEALNTTEKYMLFTLSHFDLFSSDNKQDNATEFLRSKFLCLLAHPKCRFIVLMNNKNQRMHSTFNSAFTCVHIMDTNETDIMTILKYQRTELENFHHILIPEELLGYAYSFAERFLSAGNPLEKTLLLLDSSAARTAAIERIDHNHSSKPILSLHMLMSVVSAWTHLPTAHLQMNKFKYSDFMHGMAQKVFGQDAAITLLGHELQQSQAHLQQHTKPFCSLLFAGPEHSGKSTAAVALAEQLFKQSNVLYFVQPPAKTLPSILDIKLQNHLDKRCISLKELIQQTPYAMIMYENIDRAPTGILDELQEILSSGYLYDTAGNQFNFRQAILILSTTLGSELTRELTKTFTPAQESSDMDLFQLVMCEQNNTAFSTPHYSPQEIADEVSAYAAKSLPTSLCQHLHVLPFLPLNQLAIEKIIQAKLKSLGKTLESRYGVELGYAQEIIRHLASEVLKKESFENKPADIDKSLKQLYFIVDQAILGQIDNKNRCNQLLLQLNDTGEILRCDWLGFVDKERDLRALA